MKDRSKWGGDNAPLERAFDVTEFQTKLEAQLRQLEEGLENLKQKTSSMSQKESLAEDSAYDQHPGDMGTETFERSKDLGIKDGLETSIAKVKGALDRIKRGTYGYCLSCKQPIPIERLRAVPEAELCVSCQEAQEVVPPSRRPVEEQVIRQDFPGSGDDEEPGNEPPLA